MQPEEMHRIHLPEWCKAAVARAKPKMDEIYERYIKPDAPVVALRDEAKACLKEVNLMTKEQIHSKWIGVHPENRYGDGLVPADVIALVSDIFKQGFSLKGTSGPRRRWYSTTRWCTAARARCRPSPSLHVTSR